MARCGCSGGSGCSCLVTSGAGIRVSGSGSATDPYVVDATGTGITGSLVVADTSTVDLTMDGSGTQADPYTLSGVATISMEDLSDVAPGAVPASGQVPVYNGTAWTFAVPPTTPPGAVSVSTGLTGDGAAATPIKVRVSGTWGTAPLNQMGTDSTRAAPVFVDSAGNLRALGDVKLSRAASPTGAVAALQDWNDGDLHLGIFGQTTPERDIDIHRLVDGSNVLARHYVTTNSGLGVAATLAVSGAASEAAVGTARRAALYQRADGQTWRSTWPAGANPTAVNRPLPFAMAVGSVSVGGNGNAVRTVTVTWPKDRFVDTPYAYLSSHTGTDHSATTNTEAWIYTGLTSGTVGINRTNDTTVTVNWLAIQLDVTVAAALAATTPLGRALQARREKWAAREQVLLDAGSFVICPTEGCDNQGEVIAVDATFTDPADPAAQYPVDEFQCGVCGTVLALGGGAKTTPPIQLG